MASNSSSTSPSQYRLVSQVEREVDNSFGDTVTSERKSTSNTMSGSSKVKQYIAAISVNLAAMAAGISLGWSSPSAPILRSEEDSPLKDGAIDSSAMSWVGSLLALGAVFGPFAAGAGADRLGRKMTLLVAASPFIISWFITATTSSLVQIFVCRFLCGIGVGAVFTVVPMYIGEIAEDSIRGALGSYIQLFITVGLLYAYAIGPYVSFAWFAWICLLVPVLFVIAFSLMPESPYYLIGQGREEEAADALRKLRGLSGDSLDKELLKIKDAVEEAQRNKGSIKDIFNNPAYKKALILSVGLVAGQQFSGVNVVVFYAQDIFDATGSGIAPEICTIIIGIVQVIASFTTSVVVDRLGRKILLLVSAVGMGIGLGVLGLFFYLKNSTDVDVDSIGYIPICSLILYIIVYCLGFGPLPWAVMGELFPSNIKSIASTATASICWLMGFIITVTFDPISNALGMAGAFWIFVVFCIGAFFFVLFLLPETKGKSLQEIQRILAK